MPIETSTLDIYQSSSISTMDTPVPILLLTSFPNPPSPIQIYFIYKPPIMAPSASSCPSLFTTSTASTVYPSRPHKRMKRPLHSFPTSSELFQIDLPSTTQPSGPLLVLPFCPSTSPVPGSPRQCQPSNGQLPETTTDQTSINRKRKT